MHKIKIPSKGNITKASQNEVDKNTKGPFLMAKATLPYLMGFFNKNYNMPIGSESFFACRK